MYASAMRKATDVMVDDHVKIGENGLLYRISEIVSYQDDELFGDFVAMKLYYAGDDTQTTIAALFVKSTERLKIYNQ